MPTLHQRSKAWPMAKGPLCQFFSFSFPTAIIIIIIIIITKAKVACVYSPSTTV